MLRCRGWKVLNMAALTYPSGWIAAVVFLRRLAWNQLTARSVAPRCLSDWIEKFEFPSLSPSQAATRGHAKAKQHRNIGKRKYLITGVRNSGHHSKKCKYLFGQIILPGKIPENLFKNRFFPWEYFLPVQVRLRSDWREAKKGRRIGILTSMANCSPPRLLISTQKYPLNENVSRLEKRITCNRVRTSQNFLFPKI